MGTEEGRSGNGGDGGDAGTVDPGQGDGVDAGGSGEGQGAPATIPADALPEVLRGRQPAEIKMILEHTVSAVRQAADENRRLREELETARRGGSGPTPSGDKGDAKPKKPLEELILEDPEAAIAMVVEKRFGKSFTELESGVGEAVFDSLRSREPSFADYEDEVREALRRGGLPAKREHIMGAFLMAAGQRALQQNRQKKGSEGKATASAGQSRSKEDKPDKGPKLTDLDREVAREMRMSEDKYLEAKKKAETGELGLRVPDGRPKQREGGNAK